MIRYLNILPLLFFFFGISQKNVAQNLKLKDYTNHLAVQFANIQNISNQVFYISDENGNINITKYSEGDTLLVTHINYITTYIYPEDIQRTNIFYMFPKPYTGQVVDIIGRQEEKEVPSQVEIIKAEQITLKNSPNAADILQSSGNVLVQKSQLGGGSPILRGFEANKVLLVIDGVRMNNAIYRGGHLQNAITIDNNVLENVEVIFGPGSVLYGSDALGGVIFYKTKDPKLTLEKDKPFTRASVMQRLASASQEKTFHIDLNVGYEKWGFLTSFTQSKYSDLKMGTNRQHGDDEWGLVNEYYQRIDNRDSIVKNPDPLIQKHSGYSQWDFLQKVIFRPSNDVKLTLNLNFSTSTDVPRFDNFTEYKNDILKWAEWYYGPQNRLLLSFKTDLYKSTKLYDAFHIIASTQLIDEDRITRKFGSNNRATREEDVTVYALNLDLNKTINNNTKVFYGAETTFNNVLSSAKEINILNNDISDAITRYPNGGSTMTTAAIYAGLNREFGKKTTLKSGVRYSYTELKALFLENPFYVLPYENIEFNNGALTGSLGLIHDLDSTWKLKIGLASAYRSPNVDDFGKIREKNGFVTIPNDELKPEYAYSSEITLQKSLKNNDWVFSTTGYYNFINNAIVQKDWLLDGREYLIIEGDTARVITNRNVNQAIIYGVNANFKAKLSKAFSFKAAYNFTYGQDISAESPLSHIPPVFGLTEITYKEDKFTATMNVMFNDEKSINKYGPGTTDNPESALLSGTPSWWTLNFYSSYYVSPMVKIQFSTENILDLHYRSFASGISAPGRNFVISVRASF